MNIGRRGFLHTLAAAAVGAATFDPKALLWTPAPKAVEIIAAADPILLERLLELDAIALQFAKATADRVARQKTVALQEVTYRLSGRVDAGLITLDSGEAGHFEPAHERLVRTVYGPARQVPLGVLRNFPDDLPLGRVDMYAPITREMRPGEPFSADVRIGVATDPDSGISARVMEFEQDGRRGARTMAMFEVAGGTWWTPKQYADKYGEDDYEDSTLKSIRAAAQRNGVAKGYYPRSEHDL